LPYPGGPAISKLAAKGDASAIEFPRALMHSHDYRFSLSGLKTAVITYIDKQRDTQTGAVQNIEDICAGFEAAVIDVQVYKVRAALKQTGAKTFCLGGGVAANAQLRQAYEQMCAELGVKLVVPPISACGDNAAMIALAALPRFEAKKFMPLNGDAAAHTNLEEDY
jgi:N6-L-threonylcarbamoyladenine synthase